MIDPKIVRKDFPILERRVHGDKRLVYLDNAATTQKPRQVIDALVDYYEQHNANVHRGIHVLGEEATQLYEGARRRVAAFIGAPSERGLIFTRSATEAINLAAYGWGRKFLKPGDEVLVSEMEHHSNLIPWQMTASATGAKLVPIPITDDGEIDLERLPALLRDRVKLVCITQMSNVLGTITRLAEIVPAAHDAGALVLVDAAQGVPHLPTNIAEIGCDFLAFSGHKMLGPTASGGLWARPELLEEMDPFLGGGEMIREVWFDHATWNEVPFKFEAGTPPIAGSIGLGAAVDYLSEIGMDAVREHETALTAYALDRLRALGDCRIWGPADPKRRGGVISFWLDDVHPHDVATILDTEGVAIRAGHHCAQPLMRRLGTPATARASFTLYNSTEDVDALIDALGKVRAYFGGPAV